VPESPAGEPAVHICYPQVNHSRYHRDISPSYAVRLPTARAAKTRRAGDASERADSGALPSVTQALLYAFPAPGCGWPGMPGEMIRDPTGIGVQVRVLDNRAPS